MGRTYLFNDTSSPKIMGGKLIPPGEGREVDDVHMPPGELPPADDQPPPAGGQADLQGNLTELLKQPLKSLVPELANFSDETLQQLVELESRPSRARGLKQLRHGHTDRAVRRAPRGRVG